MAKVSLYLELIMNEQVNYVKKILKKLWNWKDLLDFAINRLLGLLKKVLLVEYHRQKLMSDG